MTSCPSVAARQRAQTLLLVADGLLDPATVVAMAADPGNEALLGLRIVDLLAEEPGHDSAAAHRDVTLMIDVTGARDTSPEDVRLTWLFHRKANRARILAFADVIRTRRRRLAGGSDEPWAGFPFSPRPTRGA